MSAFVNKRRPGEILMEAAKRAAGELEITSRQLALILGVDKTDPGSFLDPDSSEGLHARQFILVFRYLQGLTGNNSRAMAHWVRTKNREFSSAPVDRMQATNGLDKIIAYLESLSQ